MIKRCLFAILSAFVSVAIICAESPEKSRLIVLTDVENEPDDMESLVRLMLYSNDIDIEGLIATTSTHMRDRIWPESIHKVIDAYAKVHPTLLMHDPAYPDADTLHHMVKRGQPGYGMEYVGAGHDTEGSDFIIERLRASKSPLWVTAWGGANTLAQALYTLREQTRDKKEFERLLSRLRVYTISDQDDSGAWMRREFPTLFYIVSPGSYTNAAWGGMNCTIAGLDEYNRYVSNPWIAANIQQGHGPLGAVYPDVAYGMEGDTPSFLGLIPNGLNMPGHPGYGGWGGRYELYIPEMTPLITEGFTGNVPIEPETRPIWTNGIDTYAPFVNAEHGCAAVRSDSTYTGHQVPVWRWRKAMQNDFAARMLWCTMPPAGSNHNPVAVLDHPDRLTVKSGDVYTLSAMASYDPDGDNLSFLWYNYPEAGTMKNEEIKPFGSPNIAHVKVMAPQVKKPQELHYILEVTDKGTPALTSYRRIIVTVLPN